MPSLDQTITSGDNSEVQVEAEQTTSSGGSTAKADNIDTVITENMQGIPVWYFLVGCLLFGMIIPQPRFIRWLF